MGNMSYCRFQITLQDLRDCYSYFEEDLSEEEKSARTKMIQLCVDIAIDFGEEVDMRVEEVGE